MPRNLDHAVVCPCKKVITIHSPGDSSCLLEAHPQAKKLFETNPSRALKEAAKNSQLTEVILNQVTSKIFKPTQCDKHPAPTMQNISSTKRFRLQEPLQSSPTETQYEPIQTPQSPAHPQQPREPTQPDTSQCPAQSSGATLDEQSPQPLAIEQDEEQRYASQMTDFIQDMEAPIPASQPDEVSRLLSIFSKPSAMQTSGSVAQEHQHNQASFTPSQLIRDASVETPYAKLATKLKIIKVDEFAHRQIMAFRPTKGNDKRTYATPAEPQKVNYDYPGLQPSRYIVADTTTPRLINNPSMVAAFAKENLQLFLETNYWNPTNIAVAASAFFDNAFVAEARPYPGKDYTEIRDALNKFNCVFIFIEPGYNDIMPETFASFAIPEAARNHFTVTPHVMLDFNALKKRLNLSAKDQFAMASKKNSEVANAGHTDAYAAYTLARMLCITSGNYIRILKTNNQLFFDMRRVNSFGPPVFSANQRIRHDELDVTTVHWSQQHQTPLTFRVVIECHWDKYWSSLQYKRAFLPSKFADDGPKMDKTQQVNKFVTQQNHRFFFRPDDLQQLPPEQASYQRDVKANKVHKSMARII